MSQIYPNAFFLISDVISINKNKICLKEKGDACSTVFVENVLMFWYFGLYAPNVKVSLKDQCKIPSNEYEIAVHGYPESS